MASRFLSHLKRLDDDVVYEKFKFTKNMQTNEDEITAILSIDNELLKTFCDCKNEPLYFKYIYNLPKEGVYVLRLRQHSGTEIYPNHPFSDIKIITHRQNITDIFEKVKDKVEIVTVKTSLEIPINKIEEKTCLDDVSQPIKVILKEYFYSHNGVYICRKTNMKTKKQKHIAYVEVESLDLEIVNYEDIICNAHQELFDELVKYSKQM